MARKGDVVSGVKADSPGADRGTDAIPTYNPTPEPTGPVPTPPPDTGPADGPRKLRDHQEKILKEVNEGLRETDSVLTVAPTGSGKTVVLSEIARQRKDDTIAVVIDGDELIKQAKASLERQTGEKVGVVQGDDQDWSQRITVISHGTLVGDDARPPEGYKPDLTMLDEAHHSAAPGWQSIIAKLGAPKRVGFTATPFREDMEPLPFAKVVRPVTPADLMERGLLVPPRVEKVDLKDSEGNPVNVNRANNLPSVYADGVEQMTSRGRKKIVLFASGSPTLTPTEVVERTTEELRRRNIDAGIVVSSGPSAKEREDAVEKFRKADRGLLVNYGTLTEGFDVADTDGIIIGRNIESDGEVIQVIGRVLRTSPGKRDGLVFDYSQRKDTQDVVNFWRIDQPSGGSIGSEGTKSPSQNLRFRSTAARRNRRPGVRVGRRGGRRREDERLPEIGSPDVVVTVA